MKQEIKRYLISSAITFIATFLLLAGSSIIDMDWEKATVASILGLIMVALRAAVKVTWELLVPLFYKLIQWAKDYLKK